MSSNIFISYNWNNQKEADEIDNFFLSKGIRLIRDKRDTDYKDSFKEFMRNVRKTDFVIMIISDEYLKSRNCMNEVLEFVKDEDFKERILPIVLKNAEKIYSPANCIEYLKHWNNAEEKLKESLKGIDPTQAISIYEEIKVIRNIASTVLEFISIVSDMKNIPLKELKETNFISLLKEIGIDENKTSAFNYTIVRQKENGHIGAKRYSANVLVDRSYNRDELKLIIKEITEKLRESNYYRNGQVKEHWGTEKAHIIWLFIAYDLEDIETINWVCRTSWIDDSLEESFKAMKLNGNDEVDGIEIDWNNEYDKNKEFYKKKFGKKEEVLELIDGLLEKMTPLADELITKFTLYQNNLISEEYVFAYVAQNIEMVNQYYHDSGNIPFSPPDCVDYDRASEEFFTIVSNMFLYFSESGQKTWNDKNRNFLMKSHIKRYEKSKIKLEIEKEKLN